MLLGGALDGPQVVAILMVLAGGLGLMERGEPVGDSGSHPFRRRTRNGWGTKLLWNQRRKRKDGERNPGNQRKPAVGAKDEGRK